MKKILIGGAGGSLSEGVISSLLRSEEHEEIIGMGAEPTDLVMSKAMRKYYVPYAADQNYKKELLKILNLEKPDLIHFQNDQEIFYASQIRDDILKTGTKMFMPEHSVIDTCVHKYKSYMAFKKAGVKVPINMIINSIDDLKEAFKQLGDREGNIWLRASSIGGGGKGSIQTNNLDMAKAWIERNDGWGDFIAAEMLTSQTVTWMSIWYNGELVVAQTRQRSGWVHGSRSVSGVTGVTKIGKTYSNEMVDGIAINSIKAVSNKPHGIFCVDMAYDKEGIPNPTEINISRFFTTVLFFTEAGLNMPVIFKDLALYGKYPDLDKKINPLPNNLIWLRAMDTEPRLMRKDDIDKEIIFL